MKPYKSIFESSNASILPRLLGILKSNPNSIIGLYGELFETDSSGNHIVIQGNPFEGKQNTLTSYAIGMPLTDKFIVYKFGKNRKGNVLKINYDEIFKTLNGIGELNKFLKSIENYYILKNQVWLELHYF